MIISRRMRWARHIARGGERELYTWFWSVDMCEMDSLKDLDVYMKIILERISKK
jgi:hypothetical protein